jgi:hypothetical protein
MNFGTVEKQTKKRNIAFLGEKIAIFLNMERIRQNFCV